VAQHSELLAVSKKATLKNMHNIAFSSNKVVRFSCFEIKCCALHEPFTRALSP